MNLRAGDLRWQTGASRWSRIRVLVISDDAGQRRRLAERRNILVVSTPLELLFALENNDQLISTVMLAGRFVNDGDLATFLGETYPQLGIDWLGAEAN
jgi:hypothetical protein